MRSPHCIMFKAPAGFAQQFRRHCEIALCGRDMDMAEVRRQLWQEPLHVGSLAIPRNYTVNSGGIEEVASGGTVPSFTLSPRGKVPRRVAHMRARPMRRNARTKRKHLNHANSPRLPPGSEVAVRVSRIGP